MKRKLVVLMIFCMMLITGCSMNTIQNISPSSMMSAEQGPELVYYDPVTGVQISETAYFCYMACDKFKEQVPKICRVSIGIGILMLLLIRKSQKAKKIALGMFIFGIPIFIVFVSYYAIPFLVDYIIVPYG